MLTDCNGFVYFDEEDLLNELYKNPDLDLSLFQTVDTVMYHSYRTAAEAHFEEPLLQLGSLEGTESHDDINRRWRMPEEYKDMDIAEWVLGQCKTDAELQRCAEELLLFQERDMFGLLQYLKYFVDTMRKNKIVWGVGRGSSVASYVLYLIGTHKIDSLFYELDIKEFLR